MAKLGFGMLRLPLTDENIPDSIDYAQVCEMVDRYLALGGQHFDTAYTYLGGKSEVALRKALVERYPRSSYTITDKLPTWMVPSRGDCEAYFQQQLSRCGVEYFDYFFLHWLNKDHYAHAVQHGLFDFLREMKSSGKARYIGFSYHDSPSLLEQILQEQPGIDAVLLQINYLDWEDPAIQSRACYEKAVAYGKKLFVMEPIKGGALASLPQPAESLLRQCHADWSPAAWALRFVASLSGVDTVLSGMNRLSQIEENYHTVQNAALTSEEFALLKQAAAMIHASTTVPCTGCRYCVNACPQHICIPDYFTLLNGAKRFPDDTWKLQAAFQELCSTFAAPDACLQCGNCEKHCPQHIPIIQYLKMVHETFK